MSTPRLDRRATARAAAVLVLSTLLSACATEPRLDVVRARAEAQSPSPEVVAPREALRRAEAYAATHPDAQIVLGNGGSMKPLYADHTVLVIRPVAWSELKAGMTVVFQGRRGQPVAHTLVRKSGRGWVAMGLSNRALDAIQVQQDNYLGTVVKAYVPSFASGAHVTPVASMPADAPDAMALARRTSTSTQL